MIGGPTLEQLRVLVAVADEGSFSAAGRRLKRAQSAVSQSIKALEASLSVQLFDRAEKAPRMSEVGRVIVDHARQILIQTIGLEAQAAAIAAGCKPRLGIAVDALFPSGPLLRAASAVSIDFPDSQIDVFTGPTFSSERRLRSGDAEIAIFGLRTGDTADLAFDPLTTIAMTPVAASSHALARSGEAITRETLEKHTQLILTDVIDVSNSPSQGVIGLRVWRFVELGRRLDFLKAGLGWCNMPHHFVAGAIGDGELVVLKLADQSVLPTSIGMGTAYHRGRLLTPVARRFLEALRDYSPGL